MAMLDVQKPSIVSDENYTDGNAATVASIISTAQTANQFYNNTNAKPMPFKYITTVKSSPADATQWTTQEKLYFNALTSVGINLFDELNNDYGDSPIWEEPNKYGLTQFRLGDTWYVWSQTECFGKAGCRKKSPDIPVANILNIIKTFVESKGTTLSAWLQKVMQRNGLAVSTPTSTTTTTPSSPSSGTTTSPTTPNNPINPPITVTATKPELQQKLIAIANSFDNNKWHMAAFMKQFVNNDANLQAMTDAVALYGYPLFDTGRGWLWETQDWICLARYLQQYPLPTSNTSCTAGSAAIALLEGEDKAIANEVALGGNQFEAQSKQKALNTVKTAYSSWYAKSDCAQKIITQQETKQQQQQQQQQQQSNADILNALGKAGENVSATSDITKYAIFGIGGVILVTGIIILLK